MSKPRTKSARRAKVAGSAHAVTPKSAGRPAEVVEDEEDAFPFGVAASFYVPEEARGAGYEDATIRVVGERVLRDGERATRQDRFEHSELLGAGEGGGAASVTVRVYDVVEGDWRLTGELRRTLPSGMPARAGRKGLPRVEVTKLSLAQWSWSRWRVRAAPARPVKARIAPLIAAFSPTPAIIPGGWIALVIAGGVAALAVQRHVLANEGFDVGHVAGASAIAIVVGIIGARLWFLVLQGRSWRAHLLKAGWCIQGFMAGAAASLPLSLSFLHLPVGAVLDATAPAILIGAAVGRLGCFVGGCCTGRPTTSSWSVWSSDRRVGTRRVPTQLMEACVTFALGGIALLLVLKTKPAITGCILVVALAAYALARQPILRLRSEHRRSRFGGIAVASASASVILVGTLLCW